MTKALSGTLDAVDEAVPMESFSTAAFATHEPYPLPSEHMFRCGTDLLCRRWEYISIPWQRPASCILCCIQSMQLISWLVWHVLLSKAGRGKPEQVLYFWGLQMGHGLRQPLVRRRGMSTGLGCAGALLTRRSWTTAQTAR